MTPFLDCPVCKTPATLANSETIFLDCTSNGNPTPSYRWMKNGNETLSNNQPIISVARVTADTTYQCVVESSLGDRRKSCSCINTFTIGRSHIVYTICNYVCTLIC